MMLAGWMPLQNVNKGLRQTIYGQRRTGWVVLVCILLLTGSCFVFPPKIVLANLSLIVSSAKAQPGYIDYTDEDPASCSAYSVGQVQPSQEDSQQMHWDCNTRDWGSLQFSAGLGPSDSHLDTSTGSSSHIDQFTLHQQAELNGNGRRIDNTFGSFSSHVDSPMSDSSRFRPPAYQAIGMHTQMDSTTDTFMISAGKLVAPEGNADSGETQKGYLSGLGYTHKPSDNWAIGGQLYHLKGHPKVQDHQSLVGLIQYQPGDDLNRYQLHTLSDSDGRFGVWIDAESRYGEWLQQYGAFSRAPGLLWADVEMENDERGYYFSSSLQRSRYDFTLGTDWRQSNLRGNSGRPGEYSITRFLNGGYQVHDNTRLQGGVNVEDLIPVDAAASLASRCYQFNTSIIQDSRFGATGFSVSKAITHLKMDRKEREKIDFSHSWQPRPSLQVKGTLSAERDTEQHDQVDGLSVGIDLKHEYRENLTWAGKLALYENQGASPEQELDVTFKYLWD